VSTPAWPPELARKHCRIDHGRGVSFFSFFFFFFLFPFSPPPPFFFLLRGVPLTPSPPRRTRPGNPAAGLRQGSAGSPSSAEAGRPILSPRNPFFPPFRAASLTSIKFHVATASSESRHPGEDRVPRKPPLRLRSALRSFHRRRWGPELCLGPCRELRGEGQSP